MNNEQIQKNVKSGYADIVKRNTKKSFLPNFFQCCVYIPDDTDPPFRGILTPLPGY